PIRAASLRTSPASSATRMSPIHSTKMPISPRQTLTPVCAPLKAASVTSFILPVSAANQKLNRIIPSQIQFTMGDRLLGHTWIRTNAGSPDKAHCPHARLSPLRPGLTAVPRQPHVFGDANRAGLSPASPDPPLRASERNR